MSDFKWDESKNQDNIEKHGVSFSEAQSAFFDENRVIAEDQEHSRDENRYYCFGYDQKGTGILTVRFTYRGHRIRLIDAGYWRKGKKIYEQTNSV